MTESNEKKYNCYGKIAILLAIIIILLVLVGSKTDIPENLKNILMGEVEEVVAGDLEIAVLESDSGDVVIELPEEKPKEK